MRTRGGCVAPKRARTVVNGRQHNSRSPSVEATHISNNEDFQEHFHSDNTSEEENGTPRNTRGQNHGIAFPRNPSTRKDIRICGEGFSGTSATREVYTSIKKFIAGPWMSWSDFPKRVKSLMWENFEKKYQWSIHTDEEIRAVWNAIAHGKMRQMFSDARKAAKKESNSPDNPEDWKDHRPTWLSEADWKVCCDYWNTEDWLKMSVTNSKNRNSNENGDEPCKHRGGSVSYAVHEARWTEVHGIKPTALQLFEHLYRTEDGDFINGKSQKTHDKYVAAVAEKYIDQETLPECDPDVWMTVSQGKRKDRAYGLGKSEAAMEIINSSRRVRTCYKTTGEIVVLQKKVEELEETRQKEKEEMEENRRKDREEIEGLKKMTELMKEQMKAMLSQMNMSNFDLESGSGSKE